MRISDWSSDVCSSDLWPNSHGERALEPEPSGDPVVAEMRPGAALLFLGSTLHGAGGNEAATIRRGMIVSYCLGWLKPYENQWLAYPPPIRSEEHTSELQSLMRISYAVFCLKKKTKNTATINTLT